ncbi:MAG: F-type H+-transporting ATPase subunit gamma [Eubacteriaceae bacterium]|nr:F-type H+-transporting ATPase subunit gamma [Eubacteriaceae bacterium]MDK2905702.1 F-type H+-transporting ATPase subunit gamma [Eubacteriaceae bacterium]MDK2936153.1 F-type H+-transporting ATPase subunit gamma [Eubacteriaceae bacterium]MDK2962013.1 F-type H+-transporting ATPase subunit gamma [Eubacteriaceae bacterium]MDN5308490.1 F-type H+-transporting ATPase subunit gamma [Eubacteriaceae bacterium]
MADNIQDIKRRIKSVNSTKQITHAMELVASAKLRKSRELAEGRRPYFDAMIESMNRIVAKTTGAPNEFMKLREVKKVAYILITADRGFAGGFNANVSKMVEEHIDNKENAVLYTVGTKGRDHFKNRFYHIEGEYDGITENPSYFHAKEVANIIMNGFKNEEFDEVYLAYTKFVSMISQKPELVRLLPLKREDVEVDSLDDAVDIPIEEMTVMRYEPEPEDLLSYLIPNYISDTIYGAMIESAASQQGARRMAMESATTNANDMIEGLTLKFNRVRQAAITQEISEIVSGAEALK